MRKQVKNSLLSDKKVEIAILLSYGLHNTNLSVFQEACVKDWGKEFELFKKTSRNVDKVLSKFQQKLFRYISLNSVFAFSLFVFSTSAKHM